MQQNTFLLYGANGYSGEMIARYATQYGLQPVLAGRRKEAIEPLANELQLPWHTIDLTNSEALMALLQTHTLVINAAGPYDITAAPMIKACLQTHTHYLDLNGDTEVFEMLHAFHQQAQEKGIMVLPGAGFDVVPTDCLALWLKNRMPDAQSLRIAFAIIGSSLSRGTTITTIQKLGLPGAVRTNGVITPEPVGKRCWRVAFPGQPRKTFTMSIPWGDISTAYYSTGIPDIVTYTSIQKSVWLFLKAQFLFNWLLRKRFIHKWITSTLHTKPAGPDKATRTKAFSVIRAEVTNTKGEQLAATIRCPEAYELTAHTMLLITKKILQGQYTPGYQTPASAYGEDLIMEIPGVVRNSEQV